MFYYDWWSWYLQSTRTISLSEGDDTESFRFETKKLFIYAYGGDDNIVGGQNDDTFYKSSGSGSFDGGLGQDKLSFLQAENGSVIYVAWGVATLDELYGVQFSNIEEFGGTNFTDNFYGDYNSSAGVTFNGWNGDDNIFGGGGADYLQGWYGNDVIEGNGGNDTVLGHYGNDRLRGGEGNDTVHGGSGNDYVRGDRGADVLSGGPGEDDFVFWFGDSRTANAAQDLITDFEEGDRLYFQEFIMADPRVEMNNDGSATVFYGVGYSVIVFGELEYLAESVYEASLGELDGFGF